MGKDIRVVRSSMPKIEEYVEEIRPLWESFWLTNNGKIHNKLEHELKEYLSVDNLALCINGHMALEMAIASMNIFGEAITTPFTFSSTTHAIARNGLKPVFCDISPVDFNIDADKIEGLITEKTSAIVVAHIYGNPCDMGKIERLASKYKLKVIYDAAQAFGVTVKGRGIGNFGDASIFSFHATKTFHTIEGGAASFSDRKSREKFVELINFGTVSEPDGYTIGLNGKMNEFQAAMGLCNLRHIDAELEKRRKVAGRYMENLKSIDGIRTVPERRGVKGNNTYFPVLIEKEVFGIERQQLIEALNEKNIYPREYFSPLTSSYQSYRDCCMGSDLKVAEYVAENILALPMYSELELGEVDRICEVIKSVANSGKGR